MVASWTSTHSSSSSLLRASPRVFEVQPNKDFWSINIKPRVHTNVVFTNIAETQSSSRDRYYQAVQKHSVSNHEIRR